MMYLLAISLTELFSYKPQLLSHQAKQISY